MYNEYSLVKFYITDSNFIGMNPDCKEESIQIIKFVFEKINKTPTSILPTNDLNGIIITYKHRNNILKIEVYKFFINASIHNEKMMYCIKNYFKHLNHFMWKLIN